MKYHQPKTLWTHPHLVLSRFVAISAFLEDNLTVSVVRGCDDLQRGGFVTKSMPSVLEGFIE